MVVEVMGVSMVPSLRPGQRVLARVTNDVEPGDVVVFRRPARVDAAGEMQGSTQGLRGGTAATHPDGRVMIKRVVRWDARGEGWWVEGDNSAASTDSRQFGSVPADLIIGRVTGR